MFEIKYKNATQIRRLILNEDYLLMVKPLQNKIWELESEEIIDKPEILRLKNLLFGFTGESWFTTESPLYKAMTNNTGLKCNIAGNLYEIPFTYTKL